MRAASAVQNIQPPHPRVLHPTQPADARETFTLAAADLLQRRPAALSEHEQTLMLAILRRLVGDAEKDVRRSIAAQLAEMPGAPRDIVLALAADPSDVAHPILERCAALADADLIEIVHHSSLPHRLAVARRAHLSAAVADALVATGNQEVMLAVLENVGAALSPATLALLVERSHRTTMLQPPLVLRRELGPQHARRLTAWVSGALKAHLAARFDIAGAPSDGMPERAAASPRHGPGGSDREPDRLAGALAAEGRVTPTLLIEALRRGDVTAFERLLGRLTGVSATLIRQIIYDPEGRGLALVSRAHGIDKPDFASIFVLSRQGRPELDVVNGRAIARALAHHDQVSREAAERILARLRRDPGDLAALHRPGDRSTNESA